MNGRANALAQLIDTVRVHPDRRRAEVGELELEATGTAELRALLASALYERFHTAGPRDARPVRRDLGLERSLDEATPHRESELTGRFVGRGDDRSVLLHGVRVAVPAHLVRPEGDLALVRVPSTRAALSPGFFLADGSRGVGRGDGLTCRVYLHVLDSHTAPGIWAAVLAELEGAELRYRAKILSSPASYPRQDALVVYLERECWDVAFALAVAVRGLTGIGTSTSPFCERIAPGVARACEPVDARPGWTGLSFGEHRSRAVAEGLLAARGSSGDVRARAVADALRAAGVNPANPHLNV